MYAEWHASSVKPITFLSNIACQLFMFDQIWYFQYTCNIRTKKTLHQNISCWLISPEESSIWIAQRDMQASSVLWMRCWMFTIFCSSQKFSNCYIWFVINVFVFFQQSCEIIHDLPNAVKCGFIIRTDDCHKNDQFIDYTHFIFCRTITGHDFEFYSRLLIMVCIARASFLVWSEWRKLIRHICHSRMV